MKTSRSLTGIVTLLTFLSIILWTNPVQASETVIFKYGFLRESISVPELTNFVQTGQLSRSLKAYLKMANRKPEEMRNLLTQEIEVDGIFLYNMLRTIPGEFLLDEVSKVIHTPTDRANRQSLRSAFVSSALEDNKITLMEVMQNYPTADVHVEGELLADVYRKIDGVVKRVRNFNLSFNFSL